MRGIRIYQHIYGGTFFILLFFRCVFYLNFSSNRSCKNKGPSQLNVHNNQLKVQDLSLFLLSIGNQPCIIKYF
jgi:hypothetical protein